MNPVLTGIAVLTAAGTHSSQADGIAAWAVSIMESLGGIGIALLIALENLFPPLPSEIILPLAGFTASRGTEFTLAAAIVWATAGSLIGALVLYAAARIFGRERTRAVMGKMPLFKESDIDKTEDFFEKHDRSTVFFGRIIPVFRSLISLPAGVIKMNPVQFVVFTAVGSAIWNTVLISAGYLLGEKWSAVGEYVGIFSKITVAVIIIFAVGWVSLRLLRNRSRSGQSE